MDYKITKKQLREFGIIMGIFFPLFIGFIIPSLWSHQFKNWTIWVGIPFLVLGAFLMERFFSLQGVGDLMITAINTGDFPVLKGLCMFIAIGYSVFMLLTDILYAYVDPRVKLG